MNLLDSIKTYKRLDKDMMAESIALLSKQIEQTLVDSEQFVVPASYRKGINKVVVSGMGGSNLGFRIIRSVFKDKLKTPLIIEAGYEVPDFVDKNTLYILSSYSGNTEEPLSTFKEAKKRKASILIITSKDENNKLARLMKSEKIPGFVFDPINNPSKQPRIGLGYSILGAVRLLEKTGILQIDNKTIEEIIVGTKKRNILLSVNTKLANNKAKILANKLYNKNVIIIGAEFLEGNAHALRNQFNENGKNFASYLAVPDLNHFALEGLNSPKSFKKNSIFLFIDSDLYHPRVRKRIVLTKQALTQNNVPFQEIKLNSKSKLSQSFEILQFGTWLTFYLALINNQNPALIPNVDWFKKQLAK